MPLTSGFTSRLALKGEQPRHTIGVPFVKALKGETPWNEAVHVRQPGGAPGSHGGEFAPKQMGAVSEGEAKQPKLVGLGSDSSKTPTDYEAQSKRHDELLTQWASINNELLSHPPDSAKAAALIRQQVEITKEIYKLNVDKGTLGRGDVGKPGGVRDIVIIGAGPGGMNAAIHGGLEGYDTLLLDASEDIGGQAAHSARVENFPEAGFPGGISGQQLTGSMFDTVRRSRADVKLGVWVKKLTIDNETGIKTVHLSDGTTIQSRVIILAGGLRAREMEGKNGEVTGKASNVHVLDGKKLATECAGKHGLVIGGSNGAAQAALDTARQAKDVTLLSRSPLTDGMSDYQRRQVQLHPKIKVLIDEVDTFETNEKGQVTGAILKRSKQRLTVDEVGLFLGGLPNTEWLDDIKTVGGIPRPPNGLPKGGRVWVDRDMETTMSGVFAVGDIRESSEENKVQTGIPRKHQVKGSNGRIAAAVGDAAIAVRNAHTYFENVAEAEAERQATHPHRKAAADDAHWVEAARRKAEMQAEIFALYDALGQLDIDNSWYQQSVEPYVDEFTEDPTAPKKAVDMPIVLKSEEQQIVYGEVYAPNRPDAQGEYMTAVDIQKMAHAFIRDGKMGQIDLMHGNKVIKGSSVVESFVADEADKRFIPHSWVIGVHIPDSDLWGSIKKGEINGFSMEALVTRHDQEVEVEIPPVVTGLTSKHEDHEHKFFVHYDGNGQFKGGMTDTVNGHYHSIVAGTHTQDAAGHRHRFSSVDNVRILG